MKKQGHVLVAAVIGVFAALSLALTTDQILHRVYDAANTALRVNVVAGGGGGGGGGAPTGAAGGDLGGTYPNPTLKDCAANEILQRNVGDTAWECAAAGGGGGLTSGTSTITSGLDTAICYDAAGVVKCDATSPLWDATARTLFITTPADGESIFKLSDVTGADNGGTLTIEGGTAVDGIGGTLFLQGGYASGSGDGGPAGFQGGPTATGNGGIATISGGEATAGTGDGGAVVVASGDSVGGAVGPINFRIGSNVVWTIDGTTGDLVSVGATRTIRSPNATGSDNAADMNLTAGTSETGTPGDISITAGEATDGTNDGGSITLTTGYSAGGARGALFFDTEVIGADTATMSISTINASSAVTTTPITLNSTGLITPVDSSAPISIATGATTDANSGPVYLSTGEVTGANTAGEIGLMAGGSTGSAGGGINVLAGSGLSGGGASLGAGSGSAGTGGNLALTAGSGAGALGDGGYVNLVAGGSALGVGGRVMITAGEASGGTEDGGSIVLTPGVSAGGDDGVVRVVGSIAVIEPMAVGDLPACAAGIEGAHASVNDSNATSFTLGIGLVVANGGSTKVPVYCDGTNWRIG